MINKKQKDFDREPVLGDVLLTQKKHHNRTFQVGWGVEGHEQLKSHETAVKRNQQMKELQ